MGLKVVRVPPNEFLRWSFDEDDRRTVLNLLREMSETPFAAAAWKREPSTPMRDFPDAYPSQRVGSYTAYGVFVLLLEELTVGVDDRLLEEDEDIERAALHAFRETYATRAEIPEARQILEMPDSGGSGAYVPVPFGEPLEVSGVTLASLPAAVRGIQAFADVLSFDLYAECEPERSEGAWLPLGTMRNVARTLFRFLSEDDSMAVQVE